MLHEDTYILLVHSKRVGDFILFYPLLFFFFSSGWLHDWAGWAVSFVFCISGLQGFGVFFKHEVDTCSWFTILTSKRILLSCPTTCSFSFAVFSFSIFTLNVNIPLVLNV